MNKQHYVVIGRWSSEELAVEVNRHIDEGYAPVGGVSVSHEEANLHHGEGRVFHQAVYKAPQKKRARVMRIKEFPAFDHVDALTWGDYLQHRREKKKPMTARTYEAMGKEFGEWVREGVDLNEAVITTIRCGWVGVFKPKPKTEHKSAQADKLAHVRDEDLAEWATRVGAPQPKHQAGYDYRMYRSDLEKWLQSR